MLLPLAPVSLIVQLFDAFLAFSLLFGSFLLYLQEGSAASIQGDMQVEAAARLKSTLSDLPDLDSSRNISFGAPLTYFHKSTDGGFYFFPNDLRCGFRKLKERGGGRKSAFWSCPGAEIFVVIIVDIPHAAARRDPILRTQRI